MGLWSLNFEVINTQQPLHGFYSFTSWTGNIKLGKKIGHGAQAEIFKAKYGLDDVVVKRFLNSRDKSITQEINILRQLTHKHIVQLYYSNHDMIVMEYVEGGNLSEAILRKALTSWRVKTQIAKDISLGLAHLHSQGIVHCDIKSSNILLTEHKEAKICDFGIATKDGESGGGGGTLQWMAPEMLQNPPRRTSKSDVYALGMVMWEMASESTRPYRGHTPDGTKCCIMLGILEGCPDSTPEMYAACIQACWALDPDKRPAAKDLFPDIVQPSEEQNTAGQQQKSSVSRGKMEHFIKALGKIFKKNKSSGFLKTSNSGCLLRDTKTIDWFDSSANSSESGKAMFKIGTMYYAGGEDVEVDYGEALEWFLAASEAGAPVAMLKISQMYQHGRGVEQDDNEAASWYSKAEVALDEHGQCSHHTIYYGAGVSKHHGETIDWFGNQLGLRTAALKNSIGVMYHDGADLEQDYKRALEWFRKASDAGDSEAKKDIGFMYRHGHELEQDYDQAVEWYIKATDGGNAVRMYNVGELLQYGGGPSEDYDKAIEWYLKASDGGSDIAMLTIGGMYETGQGVEQDIDRAMAWYLKASNARNAEAMASIGTMYYTGEGVEQNIVKAMEWYLKASNAGNAAAMLYIGNMYYHNCDGAENYHDQALKWYLKAGKAGDPRAMFNMGLIYYNGEGVERDHVKAQDWFLKAAAADWDPSLRALADLDFDDQAAQQDLDEPIIGSLGSRRKGHQGHIVRTLIKKYMEMLNSK